MANSNQVGKYLIFHMVAHTEEYYQQSPEEENESQRKINSFFEEWYPKIRQITAAHCMNMAGEWDWIGVFTTDEPSYWEAMREEYKRRFKGRTKKNISYLGVSHNEFIKATKDITHYKQLREFGMFPGMVENYKGT